MTTLREALEAALVENPDDLATHMAYADHLQDLGDPRGELIQVQLALEEEGRSAGERAELARREWELLVRVEETFLGDLHPLMLDQAETGFRHTIRRGWVDRLELGTVTLDHVRRLVAAPALRLLQSLSVYDQGSTVDADEGQEGDDPAELRRLGIPEDLGWSSCLCRLALAPWVGGLRHLQVGEDCLDVDADDFNCLSIAEGLEFFVTRAPRLQSLRLFTHGVDAEELFALPTLGELRELVYFHGRAFSCEPLAENPSLANLRTLILHPRHVLRRSPTGLESVRGLLHSPHLLSLRHLGLRLSDMGNAGCQELLDSGILERLQVLDLRHGCIGDAGARLLMPALLHLKQVELSDNEISLEVWQEMVDAGVPLVGGVDSQHEPGDDSWRHMCDSE